MIKSLRLVLDLLLVHLTEIDHLPWVLLRNFGLVDSQVSIWLKELIGLWHCLGVLIQINYLLLLLFGLGVQINLLDGDRLGDLGLRLRNRGLYRLLLHFRSYHLLNLLRLLLLLRLIAQSNFVHLRSFLNSPLLNLFLHLFLICLFLLVKLGLLWGLLNSFLLDLFFLLLLFDLLLFLGLSLGGDGLFRLAVGSHF